jgi:hypothetical protein
MRRSEFSPSTAVDMPPCHSSSGYRGVRARPTGSFYTEIRSAGYRLTLGTVNDDDPVWVNLFSSTVSSSSNSGIEFDDYMFLSLDYPFDLCLNEICHVCIEISRALQFWASAEKLLYARDSLQRLVRRPPASRVKVAN